MSDKNIKTWEKLIPSLSEAQLRWYVAQKAMEFGRGGIEKVHEITGISRPTIRAGIRELKSNKKMPINGRSRVRGGGRKSIDNQNPDVRTALGDLLDENTKGDPMSLLKWTGKSCRSLSDELNGLGYKISYRTVWKLIIEEGFSLQANKKNIDGESDADRDDQFRYINGQVKRFMKKGNPVISVDGKKKEKIGNFKNQGQTWRKKGEPIEANIYDFENLSTGSAAPYGAYDLARNEGFVNVGVSHDTAEFAVESINRWWRLMGFKYYRNAKELLICADSGGSNGAKNKLWKAELQNFSDKTGLKITTCHFPPGTSKWNKIEHRMFSFISLNWRGKPLTSYGMIINCINNTTTKKGLKIRAKLDKHKYETGIEITKEEMDFLQIACHERFPAWNYTITPRKVKHKK